METLSFLRRVGTVLLRNGSITVPLFLNKLLTKMHETWLLMYTIRRGVTRFQTTMNP